MALEGVVVSAGGLRVAQRGSTPHESSGLRVGAVAAVEAPQIPPTETRRSDGVVWRRHWLVPGRLVIDFVGVVLVEVGEGSGTVVFDRHLDAEMEQHLLFDHVLPLVLAWRGEVVVHGGVISLDGRGAVLIGPSGSGKSTLTAFAWQRGWTVGGDDGAVLSASNPPTVEPTYATVRLTPGTAGLLGLGTHASSPVVGKVRLDDDGWRRFHQGPVELRLIAGLAPAPAGDEARFERLDGIDAHALLFGSTFHAELRGHRLLPGIIERLATVVEATTVGRLVVPRGIDGLAAAEQLLRTTVGRDEETLLPGAGGGGRGD